MDILVIEPFHGGSHEQLIKVLAADSVIGSRLQVHSLPAKKWHWRARTSALHFMQTIQSCANVRVLFSSSVLNLAELVALRPDVASLWKVVYFHENQLVYPVRKQQDRDFHYGYSQITTCLVADAVVFNSEFNKESFLKSISSHLKLMPDYRPKDLEAKIRPKCRVIYFPVDFQIDSVRAGTDSSNLLNISYKVNLNNAVEDSKSLGSNNGNVRSGLEDHVNTQTAAEPERQISPPQNCCLHIVWPHRWEHDKDPDTFFQALFQLIDDGFDFKVSVLGECYQEIPAIFNTAKHRLGNRVMSWGFQDRDSYRAILDNAHVAVSTAVHEFFGVSMLEATSRGCFPLCPKRLVYPEIYPDECLYSTHAQLVKRLKNFCRRPDKIQLPTINLERFSWNALKQDYYNVLKCDA